jgi:hypothetical protein
VRATQVVGSGKHSVQVRFEYAGGGAGKGGKVTLSCDGQETGTGRVEKTVPALFSFDDFLDIGQALTSRWWTTTPSAAGSSPAQSKAW